MTDIVISLADGRQLSFPEGTSTEVINKVAKQQTLQSPQTDEGVFNRAASNFLPSAGQFATDLATPFLHPIETATNIYNLGEGIIQLAIPGEQGNEEMARSVGNYLADRYGGFENIKETFAKDPVGLAGDIAMIFTGGGALAAKVPGIVGKAGNVAQKFGRAIDPMTPVSKTAGAGLQLTGEVGKHVLGMTTGAGYIPIDEIVRAGREGGEMQTQAIQGMRGDDVLEPLNRSKTAVSKLYEEKSADYTKGMDEVAASKTPIDFGTIDDIIAKIYKQNTKMGADGNRIFKGGDKMQSKLSEIEKEVAKFRRSPELHTASDVDWLKQSIDDLYEPGPLGRPVTSVKRTIRNEIIKQAPKYEKVMQRYEKQANYLKDIEAELSLGKKANPATANRKIMSAARDNVNANFGNRAEIVRNLDPGLMPLVAGSSLKEWTPRGLARLTGGGLGTAAAAGLLNPWSLIPSLAIQSPRLVGELGLKVGQAQRLGAPIAKGAGYGLNISKGLRPLEAAFREQGLFGKGN
tara:strand:- start:5222 stop:6778 length:1557 start_codon:yes stop_codon:yes gene_type:complete